MTCTVARAPALLQSLHELNSTGYIAVLLHIPVIAEQIV